MCGTVDSLVDTWHNVSSPVLDTPLGNAALLGGAAYLGLPYLAGEGAAAGATGAGMTAPAGSGLTLAGSTGAGGLTATAGEGLALTGGAGVAAGATGAGLGAGMGTLTGLEALGGGLGAGLGTYELGGAGYGGYGGYGGIGAGGFGSFYNPEVAASFANLGEDISGLNANADTLSSIGTTNALSGPSTGLGGELSTTTEGVPADSFYGEGLKAKAPTTSVLGNGTLSSASNSPYALGGAGADTGTGLGLSSNLGAGTAGVTGAGLTVPSTGYAGEGFWKGAVPTNSPNFLQQLTSALPTAYKGLKGIQLASGLYDMYAKRQMANAQQDRFNTVNQQIEGMYAPGSPEEQMMRQQLERADAKAGRNSQYGQRAVELAARIADIKSKARQGAMVPQNQLMNQGLTNQYGGLNSLFGYMGKNEALGSLGDLFNTGAKNPYSLV